MSNKQLLRDIQKRQKELRMQSINPDKVEEVLKIKNSFVKYENLQAFETAIASLLAKMEQEIENINSKADKFTVEAREEISRDIKEVLASVQSQIGKMKQLDASSLSTLSDSIKRLSEQVNSVKGMSKQSAKSTQETLSKRLGEVTDKLRDEFAQKISSLEKDLFDSIDDIETLKKQPAGSIPKGLIEKINSFVVQRSVNIPVTTDQGGLGTTVKPTAGQVPVGNADGTYTPGTVTSAPSVPSGEYLYFGDSGTDGSWRISVSGNNLIIERRESSAWAEKGSYLP